MKWQKFNPDFNVLFDTDFVDDGVTMITTKHVRQYTQILESKYQENSIKINFQKSKIILNSTNKEIQAAVSKELSDFDLQFEGNFTYLGVQHGQKDYINLKINELCNKLNTKLLYIMTINDKQIQQLLLRKFMNYNKVIFTLKTATICNEWLGNMDAIYEQISHIITKYVNYNQSMQYQMALAIKNGGFGLRRPSEHIIASKITSLSGACQNAENCFRYLPEAR